MDQAVRAKLGRLDIMTLPSVEEEALESGGADCSVFSGFIIDPKVGFFSDFIGA